MTALRPQRTRPALLAMAALVWLLGVHGEPAWASPTDDDPASGEETPSPRRARAKKRTDDGDKPLRAKDAAFIVVRANFKTTTVAINDKPYPKNSPIGAAVAPGKVYEVVVADNKTQTTKRYKVKLKRGEAYVLIVDLSGGTASPISARPTSAAPPATSTPAEPAAQGQEAAEAGNGFLTVNATPSAQVYVDGKLVSSSTPLVKHSIAPGNHTVRVYYVELKKFSETKRAMITEGRHINLYFNSDQK